jgi:hypothetical protein
MPFWTFWDYITEDHKWPINDWWRLQPGDVQAAFDLLIKVLSETEDWEAVEPSKRKHKVLTNRHAGMCELMLEVEGFGRYRGLGLWRPEEMDFIFFGACRKRSRFFSTVPPNAFDDAYKLMQKFKDGKGVLRDHV